ncbi:glycosyltransferase family 4 protein [Flavobacteriaceae bacterium F89]|uniref:Glycosyltransferase family 4 protein n=1 Tax=Cerina litoralis TaxID=2874477 RepID=A0AAE3EZI7_9FLAO|nr:glycosyltransferase family 4 protein [Cerina litoralis]MCG2462611.1 glycosyltransferase family 4 protein [Cerina litoralis]
MKKLAIITTHPIQYHAPWFRLLAATGKVDLKVFYTWSQTEHGVVDRTFGQVIHWDVPLLDGYNYEFVRNVAKDPGSHHKAGIDCPGLIGAIETFNPDIVLVFGWNFKSHFQVMKYFKGRIPVWFRGDSTLLGEKRGIKRYFRRLSLRYVYRYIDKAFYVGSENKKYFKAHGLKEDQLVFAPHAVDNIRFFDSIEKDYHNKAQTWRKELGYGINDLVVLFAGKFENKKRPHFLVNIVKAVNEVRQQPIKLLLVGNGPQEDSLKTISENDRNIQFLPFQNQTMMPIIYRVGNVYCLPSQGPDETWGLGVNEAMASGRGVILSDKVGCGVDLIVVNENGYIFKDSEILKQKLIGLTMEKCKKLGASAQKDIKPWDFNVIVKSILESL